ncbi:MAG: restriction endonuclease subunit S [Pseudomonadota bacterium]|nr:restriction endonuclease subunit S [Pseudomonadota bacterium]
MTDWPWKTLEEVVASEPNSLTDGPFGSKLKSEHYTDSGVRVVRLGNLGVGEFKHDDRSFVSPKHATDLGRHRLFEGDLLIAALAEPIGRCCEVPTSILPAIVKADCIRFRPKGELNRRFVMHWLNSPIGRKNAENHSHGVGRLRINMGAIRELPVPVPSRAVQDQTVAAIETYFSRLDAAVASLTRANANVRHARASVLKAAVEGRLVPTEAELARSEGRDYEPASVLVERILAERKAAWARSGGCGRYHEPVGPEREELPPLPKGWTWATIGQVAESQAGHAFKSGDFTDEGVNLLRGDNIGHGSLRWGDRRRCIAPHALAEHESLQLAARDIVLAMDRPVISTGLKLAVVATSDLPALLVQRVLRLRPRVELRYFLANLRSPAFVAHLEGEVRGGGVPHISEAQVRAFPVPVPPRAEQGRIAAEVDRRLSVLDALDTTIDTNLARCKRLRQSILKRAFEGRLVPAETRANA